MTYRGVASGNVVRLPETVKLPNGTPVQVVVEGKKSGRGNARAIARALAAAPRCAPADVDALSAAIAEGKKPVR